MRIILYDINKDVTDAWKKEFNNENVDIQNISIESLKADYVVTAGNSYAWMTGGIDLAVRNYFGQQIQDKIQEVLMENRGYLPVGSVMCVGTGDIDKPYLLYVPTMETPRFIFQEDIYFVACKIFRFIKYNHTKDIESKSIAICGLGTGTGFVTPEDCAKAMYKAYKDVLGC